MGQSRPSCHQFATAVGAGESRCLCRRRAPVPSMPQDEGPPGAGARGPEEADRPRNGGGTSEAAAAAGGRIGSGGRRRPCCEGRSPARRGARGPEQADQQGNGGGTLKFSAAAAAAGVGSGARAGGGCAARVAAPHGGVPGVPSKPINVFALALFFSPSLFRSLVMRSGGRQRPRCEGRSGVRTSDSDRGTRRDLHRSSPAAATRNRRAQSFFEPAGPSWRASYYI